MSLPNWPKEAAGLSAVAPVALPQSNRRSIIWGIVAGAGSRYRGDIVIPRDLADDKLVPLPIRLPEDLYEWLREAAHRRRMPMAELVREALREYRESQDPQIDLWTRRDAGR